LALGDRATFQVAAVTNLGCAQSGHLAPCNPHLAGKLTMLGLEPPLNRKAILVSAGKTSSPRLAQIPTLRIEERDGK
jgi:hypothetical protein